MEINEMYENESLKFAGRPSISSSNLNMATSIGRRSKFLNCLPFILFPTFSCHFLPFCVLSCSLLSFLVLWCGRVDGRTGGHTDVRTYGRMDGLTDNNFIQEEKRQTDILFYYYIIYLYHICTFLT